MANGETSIPAARAPVPSTDQRGPNLRWELTGAGLESFSLQQRPLPRPGPDQLLVRIDACGICFSDIKILRLGPDHPRLQGRDLTRQPVVMGHEAAMTVLEVGEERQDDYRPGQRFLIQADILYRGEGLAFGYKLEGGYSQYQLITREVLDGDEGCYLLPIAENVGCSQAGLAEPWACVEAAYAFAPRIGPDPEGKLLIVSAEGMEGMPEDQVWPKDIPEGHQFMIDGRVAIAPKIIGDQGPYTDALFWGLPSQEIVDVVTECLEKNAVIRWERIPPGATRMLDVGRIHYEGHWHVGSRDGTAEDAYAWRRTAEITPGGLAWFIGAGGPLGQMQLERTFSLLQPPGQVVVSQRSGPRFDNLREKFEPLARERGVEFTLLDARALGDDVYEEAMNITGGRGFDDIVIVVPDVEVMSKAMACAADGGGVDLFAGIAVGGKAEIPVDRLAHGVRMWGTTGSKISDLRSIVAKVEAGELDTDSVVAAVGGIHAVREGLEAVRDGRFLGKTVIYPQLEKLPLTTVDDLAAQHPSLRERLTRGRYWNRAAEAEMLRIFRSGVK